jgi:hypothetical protein
MRWNLTDSADSVICAWGTLMLMTFSNGHEATGHVALGELRSSCGMFVRSS